MPTEFFIELQNCIANQAYKSLHSPIEVQTPNHPLKTHLGGPFINDLREERWGQQNGDFG